MILPPENFSVRPLFYDALSAEFMPKIDLLNRAHTLGRLTMASVLKGEFSVYGGFKNARLNDNYPVFQYSPSWAPRITSKVDAEWTVPGKAVMYGILLEDDENNTLYVANEVDKNGVQKIFLGTRDEETRYVLELGDKLFIARDAVAEAADQFFNAPTL